MTYTLGNKSFRNILFAVIVVLGVALSIIVSALSYYSEKKLIQAEFNEAAENHYSVLKRELDSDLSALASLQALYYTSGKDIERSEFRNFTSHILEQHASIKALNWIPRVPDSRREAYERAARREGFPDFKFTERIAQGKMKRIEKRKEYFPVYFVEPYKGNEIALGFDVASNPTRLETLEVAGMTGEIRATARVILVPETRSQFGFLVFAPIYKKGVTMNSDRSRWDNLEGFVLGTFRISDIAEKAINYLKPAGVDFFIYDASAPEKERFLYTHSARTRKTPLLDQKQPETDVTNSKTLEVAGRKWMVIYSATPDFIAARSSWRPWGLLLAGLVFTGLVAGFLVIVRHAEHAEKSAKDLSDLNANLAREIMERKRAEAVRKESQERLLTILNSMDACVYISDIKTYELLFVNNYVKDLFGDIVGQPCWKTLQAGQSGPCAFCTNDKLLDAAGNPEGICHWEFQNTVNGRWYDIHDRAIPWTDGRIVRMEIATDITERKRVEEKLQESYEDMESFSYSVSHDLRAPLRTIGGLSEILLKNYYDKLDDKGKSFLNLVLENIKRMDQLILALLNLSRVGRQQLKIVEIDMEKEAALIAGDLRAMAPERNITLDVGKLPPAHGDLALIRQVFTNLLSNAVKFTKERDVACIEVGGRCEGSENIYYVKDDGPGFDPELTDKLFKVFQRLHSAQEFEGIGIGLSIVHRIISRHDGRVWAEGRPDKGATFYFSLPKGKA